MPGSIVRLVVDVLVAIVALLLPWGWIILLVAAVAMLLTMWWSVHRTQRILSALFLFVLAIGWQQATQPLNFGVRYGHIRSQEGDTIAYVLRKGWSNWYLVVCQDGEKTQIPGGRGWPDRIIWIDDGKRVGVIQGDSRAIIDINLWTDPTIDSRPLLPEEERRLNHPWQLTPEEEKTFDAALKAAEVTNHDN